MANLKPRQEAFCLAYAKSGNATGAYREAGYKVKTDRAAGANAARLLGNDRVQARLAELRERTALESIMDATEMQEALSEIARDTTGRVDLRMKAMALLAKMQGLFVNRSEINGDLTIDVVLERAEDGETMPMVTLCDNS